MAILFADGFDLYGQGSNYWTDPYTVGNWSGYLSNANYGANSTTRFGSGQSFQLGYSNGNPSGLYKAFAANSTSTVYASFAILPLNGLDGSNSYYYYVNFLQGGTNQVSVQWFLNGNINVYRNGTLIASFSGAHVGAIWTHWQIKLVLSATVGEIRIKKNGDANDTFVATGLNTLATSTAVVDRVEIYNMYYGCLWDDFIVCDSSGSVNNSWTGDVRCYTLTPSGAGSVANFAAQGAGGYLFYPISSSVYFDANLMRLTPFVAPSGMSVGKITISFQGGFTGNGIIGLYADAAGSPGTLLATSNQVTNPGPGNNDFTFASPPAITSGATYWVGLLTNSAVYINFNGNNSGSATGKYVNITYTTSLPSALGGFTNTYDFTIIVCPALSGNSAAVVTSDGDSSYTYASTVGNQDLLTMTDLVATPTSILAVQQRLIAKKSDAGARSLQTELKSGATTVQGASTALSASYGPVTTLYETDPNTSAAWTATAVNALEAGYKISG